MINAQTSKEVLVASLSQQVMAEFAAHKDEVTAGDVATAKRR